MRMAIETEDPSENRILPVLFPFIAADVKKNHGNDTYIRHGRPRDPGARAFVLCIRPFLRSSCSEDRPAIREINASSLMGRKGIKTRGELNVSKNLPNCQISSNHPQFSLCFINISILPGIEGLPNYIKSRV